MNNRRKVDGPYPFAAIDAHGRPITDRRPSRSQGYLALVVALASLSFGIGLEQPEAADAPEYRSAFDGSVNVRCTCTISTGNCAVKTTWERDTYHRIWEVRNNHVYDFANWCYRKREDLCCDFGTQKNKDHFQAAVIQECPGKTPNNCH